MGIALFYDNEAQKVRHVMHGGDLRGRKFVGSSGLILCQGIR